MRRESSVRGRSPWMNLATCPSLAHLSGSASTSPECGAFRETFDLGEREHLAPRGDQKIPHIGLPHREAPTCDACHDFEPGLVRVFTPVAHCGEPEYPCHLVSRRPVVIGHLGFNNRQGRNRVWAKEVGILLPIGYRLASARSVKWNFG